MRVFHVINFEFEVLEMCYFELEKSIMRKMHVYFCTKKALKKSELGVFGFVML